MARPTDQKTIELLENVEERHDGYVRSWLEQPAFREALRNPVRGRYLMVKDTLLGSGASGG